MSDNSSGPKGSPKNGPVAIDAASINTAQRRALEEGVGGAIAPKPLARKGTTSDGAQSESLAGAFRKRGSKANKQSEEVDTRRPVEKSAAQVAAKNTAKNAPDYRPKSYRSAAGQRPAPKPQNAQSPTMRGLSGRGNETEAEMDEDPMTPVQPGAFPTVRLRRNRRSDWSRRLVAENRLTVDDLIWPIFLQAEEGVSAIEPMPGVVRYGPDQLIPAVNEAVELGIPMVALFPQVPESLKTQGADEAFNPDNLVCGAVRQLKQSFEDLGVMCDVALDPYNSDGHDGLVDFETDPNGIILNDETLEVLIDQALVQAEAGCDVIAPSDMMDGRVGVIRTALDEAGFEEVQIMSYAAKYASAFYGPFRSAIGSGAQLKGDKKTYQMSPANRQEALREVKLDIDEGADMVMIKPGMPYLDIIREVKSTYGVPTFAYQVSGEYAMLAAAAENGWLNGSDVMAESLLSFKRAGADGIMTYAALDVARELGR